jgi:type VI secretion system secreted protein Hcp
MPVTAYMSIEGQVQGPILGPTTDAGREGWIGIHAYSHSMAGGVTGPTRHTPITVFKPFDQTTPQLLAAWVANERLEVQLHFIRPVAGTAEEQVVFTVTLTGATIAEVRHEQLNNRYPENLRIEPREQVSFAYANIRWIWTAGLITQGTDWGL